MLCRLKNISLWLFIIFNLACKSSSHNSDKSGSVLLDRQEINETENMLKSSNANVSRKKRLDRALLFQGKGNGIFKRLDKVRINDVLIDHDNPKSYAIHLDNSSYGIIKDVDINCNNIGRGGILLGDTNDITNSQAYLCRISDVNVANYTNTGLRFNSKGSQLIVENCTFRSRVNGANGLELNSKMFHITGGQIGANNVGGIPIWVNNRRSSDIYGGLIENLVFEHIRKDQFGIVVDGTEKSWVNVEIRNIRANLNDSCPGTIVKFGRAKNCTLINPIIKNPTRGGFLCEFGSDSRDCRIELDYIAAKAPIKVSPNARRPLKIVNSIVSNRDVKDITVYPNLTTIIRGGVVELSPSFVPVHNGVSWNYGIVQLDNGEQKTILPPNTYGKARIVKLNEEGHDAMLHFNLNSSTGFSSEESENIKIKEVSQSDSMKNGITYVSKSGDYLKISNMGDDGRYLVYFY